MLGADWSAYESLVKETLCSDIDLLNKINGGLLANVGKQLRPIMSLLWARACNGSCTPDSYHYAAAAELLHNATLIHDDIVDESQMRRGKPTIAALMGSSAAVLVGDFWLSAAVRQVVGTVHQIDAIRLYSRTLTDLAEGEMLQMEKAELADTTEEDYLRIIFCKTASLFESCCRSAALAVDASPELIESAGRYGKATGLAFQIRDDIFDYQDGNGIGKPVRQDLMERKITLPMLGALRNSPDEARLRAMVREIPEHPEYCEQLYRFVHDAGGVEYAASRLNQFISEALEALELLPPSAEKEMLAGLARYNAIRKL